MGNSRAALRNLRTKFRKQHAAKRSTNVHTVMQAEAWGVCKQASQQSARKQKQYTNFSDTDRAETGQYAALIFMNIIVTTRVPYKSEGKG